MLMHLDIKKFLTCSTAHTLGNCNLLLVQMHDALEDCLSANLIQRILAGVDIRNSENLEMAALWFQAAWFSAVIYTTLSDPANFVVSKRAS